MAGATPVDDAQLCQLLQCFLAKENTVRQEAEERFSQLKTTQPDGVYQGLLRVLREHPEGHVRQQASVTLRVFLRDTFSEPTPGTPSLWARLSDETKQALRVQLLNGLESEPNRQVRHSLCNAIADLGVELAPIGEWPELNARLVGLVESSVPGLQACGLQVLSELAPVIADVVKSNAEGFQKVVCAASKAEDAEVRYACLQFVTALVLIELRSVWRRVQNTLPDFLEGLQALIQAGNEELATKFLVKLVEIAEHGSAFFKPHLGQLAQMLFALARNAEVDDEQRQLAVEVLLCIAEDKSQMVLRLKSPNFVLELVRTLLELMLTVAEDDSWIDQLDQADGGAGEEDEMRNYDVGEAGLDRLAAALGGENVINTLFSFVSQYLRREEWQYKLVGLMAISQTAEYLPEEGLQAHLAEITNILLSQLKDPHHRVRFAACQAIGQIALDHQPLFQNCHADVILPALINAIDDPVPRVQSHGISAFVNFAEDVTKEKLLPYANTLMEKLFQKLSTAQVTTVRENCVTGIAVVAGVLQDKFLEYYPVVVPVIKEILIKCTGKDERKLRGRAAECIGIIGISVGAQAFEADAYEVMQALLMIAGSEEDEVVKEYIQETFCKICRTLGEKFCPFVQHLMPSTLKTLEVPPDMVEGVAADSFAAAERKYASIKTSIIEDMIRALDLLTIFLEVLGDKLGEYLLPISERLIPLLSYYMSDDVKHGALTAMSGLFGVARTLKVDPAVLQAWMLKTANAVVQNLHDVEQEEGDLLDVDAMQVEVNGLVKCLREAGPNTLTESLVGSLCTRVMEHLERSTQRIAELETKKNDPDFDEEDVARLEETAASEQSFRSELLEVVGSVMVHHPDLFIHVAADMTQHMMRTYFQPNRPSVDRALALYFVDDLLEHLNDRGVSLWPYVAEPLVGSLGAKEPEVRRAAAYGVIQAAKCSTFPTELVQRAATLLSVAVTDPVAKESSQVAATDNCIAALGAIVLRRGAQLHPSPQQYLQVWIDAMPLQEDEDEGRRTHHDLVELLIQKNPEVLGPNNSNVPKLTAICAAIYKTAFSTAETDFGIRQFIEAVGIDTTRSLGATFNPKIQEGLWRIHADLLQNRGEAHH